MSWNQHQKTKTESATLIKEASLPQRYSWIRQPWHTNQRQQDWADLAVALFNVDFHDILLNGSEKRDILSFLTAELTPSENNARYVSNNPWIQVAQRMCKGTSQFGNVKMYGALLRYQLNPPGNWYLSDKICRCLGALEYLQRCADGRDIYTKEGMRDPPAAAVPRGVKNTISKEAETKLSEGRRTPRINFALNEQSPSANATTPWTPTPRRSIRATVKQESSKTFGPFVLPSENPSFSTEPPRTPTPASRKKKIILKTSPSSKKKSQHKSSNLSTTP